MTISTSALARASAAPEGAAERIGLRRLLLAAILAALALVKVAIAPYPVGHHAVDGSNFFQIARHVADGDGLQTSVSLYHQGLRELPHASFVYPLWPLALGAAAGPLGLERAAQVLPVLFFLLSLTLLQPLVDRLARELAPGGEAVPGGGGVVTVGHVAVVLFGTSSAYFQHTSLPYSEGIAFTLAFAALLAVGGVRGTSARRIAAATLAGGLAGLAYLARSQMVGLAIAVPVALLLCRDGTPRARAGAALAALLAALAVATPWAISLAALPDPSWPRALLDFTGYRETAALPPFQLSVPADGIVALLRDRAAGLAVAFSPSHPFSYARSFGMSVYLVPLAAIALAWTLLTGASSDRAADAPAAPSATALAALLAAAGCLAPVHLHHATYIWEWWFHWRHGLPLVFALIVALAWLNARGPRWARLVAVVLVAWTLAMAPLAVNGLAAQLRSRARGPHPDEQALVAWVAAQPLAPLLVTTHPQALAAFGRGGRYHWIDCKDPPSQLHAMRRLLGIDGVVVYPGEEGCAWHGALADWNAVPHRFGEITVWRTPPATAG